MGDPFSITKFLLGFLTPTHWAKTVALGSSFVLLTFVGYGVYKAYFKAPLPSTSQSAEEITNYYHQPRVTFGCAHWKGSEKFPTNALTTSE